MKQTNEERKAEAENLTNSKNSGEWFNENSRNKDDVTNAKRELLEDYHTGGNKEDFIKKWVSVKEDLEDEKEHFRTGGDPEAAQIRADNKEKIEVKNKYLLKSVEADEMQKMKYKLLMAEATVKLDETEDLKREEKENIVKELNTECGVGVIKHFHKSAPNLIYAGLCMAKGGDPYLGEMHTRPDNRPEIDKEFQINNKYLMKEVDGLPDLTKKYHESQSELSKQVFYSQITFSDKKKIVDMLNSEAGAKLIAKHSNQAEVTVYAALCVSGDERALDKYELKEEVKKESMETGKKIEGDKTMEQENHYYIVETDGEDYGLCKNGELEKNMRDGRYGDGEELMKFKTEDEAKKALDKLDVLNCRVNSVLDVSSTNFKNNNTGMEI